MRVDTDEPEIIERVAALDVAKAEVARPTLHWFTECGRPDSADARERFLLQGVIRFEGLRIDRQTPVPCRLLRRSALGSRGQGDRDQLRTAQAVEQRLPGR